VEEEEEEEEEGEEEEEEEEERRKTGAHCDSIACTQCTWSWNE
jgi:hypothetical protein